MPEIRSRLYSKDQTGEKMYAHIKAYATDLRNIKFKGKPLCDMPLLSFFDFVRTIPYKRDTAPIEVIGRPSRLFEEIKKNGGIDCKKKAILISSWAYCNGIPFRLIASSNRTDKRIHHVYPQLAMSGEWKNADATYSSYRFAAPKNKETHREVLMPNINDPEMMGFVASIISAAAALGTTIAKGVIGKRQQRRAQLAETVYSEQEKLALRKQQLAEKRAALEQAKIQTLKQDKPNYWLSVGLPVGLFLAKKFL